MKYRVRTIGPNDDAVAARLREEYRIDLGPEREAKRAADISRLPTVIWKGRRLYTIRCDADFGRGPHLMNLPEYILWALISLERYRCPFHR